MPSTVSDESLTELRETLAGREARARVRAEAKQWKIRRKAEVAGEVAATRYQVAESGEARALRAARTRSVALAVLLPVLAAFAAWSAAGVQAGMVALLGLEDGSPAAAAAWLVEPALIGIVAGVIVIRARLQSLGGDLDERAVKLEYAALVTSIVLNMAGHWPSEFSGGAVAAMAGHALGPLGAAGTAVLIAAVQDGIATTRPWKLDDGSPAPSLRDTDRAGQGTPWDAWDAEASPGQTERPASGWITAPEGVRLLPIVPSGDARETEETSRTSHGTPRRPAGWVDVPPGARLLPIVPPGRPAPAPASRLIGWVEAPEHAVLLPLVAREETPRETPEETGQGTPGTAPSSADGTWTLQATEDALISAEVAEGLENIDTWLTEMGRPFDTGLQEADQGDAEKETPEETAPPADGTAGGDSKEALLERAREALSHEPGLSVRRLAERLGCSHSHAHRMKRQIREETAEGTPARPTRDGGDTGGGEGR